MNKEDFVNLSLNPNNISNDSILSLEAILEEYPYFQTAQVLHLKGLKHQKSFKYNKHLKKVAAYTTNRTVLFDFITSDVLDFEEKVKLDKDLLQDIEVVDSNIIEHLQESIAAQEEANPISNVSANLDIQQVKEELEIGSPINFDKNDSFSFNEWLDLTPQLPIDREKSTEIDKTSTKNNQKISESKLKKQLDLIDSFIVSKPKIKPDKSQKNNDIAVGSVEENTSLMTETLARVYLEQKKYNKAISAFKILSLKYPEKSGFFADKINGIKFLQKHKS